MSEDERRQLRFVSIVCLIGGGACCLWNLAHGVQFLRFLRRASAATGTIQSVRSEGAQAAVVWRFQTPEGRAYQFEQRVADDESTLRLWPIGRSAPVACDPADPVGTAVLSRDVLSDHTFYSLLGVSILGLGIGLRRWGAR